MLSIQDIHIGDNVRFLDTVGGGRVTRIDIARKLIYVEDTDGFEIPTVLSQIVVDQSLKASTESSTISSKESIQPTPKDLQTKDLGTANIPSKEERRAKGKKDAKREDILEIDLHISALNDHWMQMEKFEIRNYQMKVFHRIMRENIRNRGKKIVFIHGRGEGILKAAIVSELQKQYPTCEYQDASFAQYGFGATMIIILIHKNIVNIN